MFNVPATGNNEDLVGLNLMTWLFLITSFTIVIWLVLWLILFRGGLLQWSNVNVRFNWHPLLMTCGIICFSDCIMFYRLYRNKTLRYLKYNHALGLTTVIILMIIALYVVISVHIELSIPHFFSLHSWAGMVTMLVVYFQWMVGLVTFLIPGRSTSTRAAIAPYHIFIGQTAFVLAIATCLLGLNEMILFTKMKEYIDLSVEGLHINILGLMFILLGIVVIYIMTNAGYKRYPRPEDNPAAGVGQ